MLSSKPSDDRLGEAAMPNAAIRAAFSARRGGRRPATASAGDQARTRLPAHALIEVVLRFGMDRIELDRLVEHVPRRWPPAMRDRWRFARLADVGENALDWATIERLLSVELLPLRFWRRMSASGRKRTFGGRGRSGVSSRSAIGQQETLGAPSKELDWKVCCHLSTFGSGGQVSAASDRNRVMVYF